jgi:hypothetical protein
MKKKIVNNNKDTKEIKYGKNLFKFQFFKNERNKYNIVIPPKEIKPLREDDNKIAMVNTNNEKLNKTEFFCNCKLLPEKIKTKRPRISPNE